jgi:hypothetical protein
MRHFFQGSGPSADRPCTRTDNQNRHCEEVFNRPTQVCRSHLTGMLDHAAGPQYIESV